MIVVLKKKNIIEWGVLVVLVTFCILGAFNGNVINVFNNQSTKKVPVYSVKTDKKVISLTFDAAWGADKTEGILKILKENNIAATFFLVGFWIDEYEDMVKKIDESSCDIANHTKNHYDLANLSKDDVKKEIDYVNEKITKITNKTPQYFRFPFGSYNSILVDQVESMNLVPIQWSVDSLDWKGLDAYEILNRVKKGAGNGGIILFHNNSDHVLDALPLVIAYLKNNDYEIVPVSKLVATKNYKVDNNGVQHLN